MKTISKIFLFSVLLVAGLSACTKDPVSADPAIAETNEIQAFIYSTTTDVVIKPGNGDTVLITSEGATVKSVTKEFTVSIGRKSISEQVKLPLIIVDKSGAFKCDTVLTFAANQSVAKLNVATDLIFGESADLYVAIPEKYRTAYGSFEKTINVAVDYTWLSAGSVTMSSQWEGTSGTVAIEKAKEFVNEEGDGLYHLVSPYYNLAPDYCTKEGLHLAFLLDKDYNIVNLALPSVVSGDDYFYQVENTGYNWIWMNQVKYEDYCYCFNSTNEYYISCLWSAGSGGYGPYIESFVWDKGYPGELIDPAEGDGELDSIFFTSVLCDTLQDEYGYLLVDEIKDELLYNSEKGAFPESYVSHYIYNVSLNGQAGYMFLQLTGDSIYGKYTAGTIDYNSDYECYNGNAGVMVKGEWNGESIQGSYFITPTGKYYLTAGSVTITDEGILVDAESASGVRIIAKYEGEIPANSPQPVSSRFAAISDF